MERGLCTENLVINKKMDINYFEKSYKVLDKKDQVYIKSNL